MILIPEWRYDKMVESFDKAMEEIARLKKALEEAGTSTKAKQPNNPHKSQVTP